MWNTYPHLSPSATPVYEATDWAAGWTTTNLKRCCTSRARSCYLRFTPSLMPSREQGFDLFPAGAFYEFNIAYPSLEINRCIVIGVHPETANLTTKRLLIGSILAVYVMTPAAFLRRIDAFAFVACIPRFSLFQAICLGICARLDALRYAFIARALNFMFAAESCS